MAKPIGDRLLEMLNGQIMTDVTFVVQGTEIKGHRTVVSSYGGPLKELLENKAERVNIPEGVSLKAFKEVLQYLYIDECTIDPANAFEMSYAAKTFQLQPLMDFCLKLLKSKLTIENLLAHASQALHYDIKEYLKICKDYFKVNTLEVINRKDFLEASNEVLLELVSTDGIGCSELELFMACLEWAENECKRKKMEPTAANSRVCLGEVLSQIKFSNMPQDDFMGIVVPTDILTSEEVGNIIKDWQKLDTRLDAKAVKEKRKHITLTKMDANAHTKNADHQVPNVNKVVQVRVKTYKKKTSDTGVVSSALPLSTRISQVKEMKIFDEGRRQCRPDKFTLAHKGKELADNTILASIYSPGEDFILKLHSFTVTIKERSGAWEFLLTFTLEEYENRCLEIITKHVQRLKGIRLQRVEMESIWHWPYPGETIRIRLD